MKKLENVITIIIACMTVWMVASFVDCSICSGNMACGFEDAHRHFWNIFTLLGM